MSYDPIKRKQAAEDALPGGYGDARRGEEIFKKHCKNCHSLLSIDNTKVGPHLAGIVDRPTAYVKGYPYSSSLKYFYSSWGPSELSVFLKKPKHYIPGNKMEFTGLPRAQDRYDVIEYLRTK